MTTQTLDEENKKKFKAIFGFVGIPYWLGIVGTSFSKVYLAAFYGAGKDSPAYNNLVGGSGFAVLLMFLLVYLWYRPAIKYRDKPTPELKQKIRLRLSTLYRDAAALLLMLSASRFILAVFFRPSEVREGVLPALLLGLLAQLCILPTAVDWMRTRNLLVMELLYEKEELYNLRREFSIPLYLKTVLLVFSCALAPFALVSVGARFGAPFAAWSVELLNLMLTCSFTLAVGLGVIFYSIQQPLDGLIGKMRLVAEGAYPRTRIFFSDEVAQLKAGFNGMVAGLREREERLEEARGETSRLESELAVSKATSDLAAQVAHDIRSPLAALGAAAGGLDLPAGQRELLENSARRIQEIADDLLRRYGAPSPGAQEEKPRPCLLAGLIERTLAEKRLQYKDRAGVNILFGGAAGARASVYPQVFQRLISNLANNAVEAMESAGTLTVTLSSGGGEISIELKDDGKGITPEILPKLGLKGETHGKAGGTGLGLYHARTAVESWGGRMKMESKPGDGTTVTIFLPAASEESVRAAVLLDDDPLVHLNWKLAARAAGAELKAFKTPEELYAAAGGLRKDIPLYIDSELGGGVKGEEIAKDFREKGFSDIKLATGRSPADFSHLP